MTIYLILSYVVIIGAVCLSTLLDKIIYDSEWDKLEENYKFNNSTKKEKVEHRHFANSIFVDQEYIEIGQSKKRKINQHSDNLILLIIMVFAPIFVIISFWMVAYVSIERREDYFTFVFKEFLDACRMDIQTIKFLRSEITTTRQKTKVKEQLKSICGDVIKTFNKNNI